MSTNLLDVKFPPAYRVGFGISFNTVSKVDVAVGRGCDSLDDLNIVLDAVATIDCAATGLNGLDAGSLAADTFYAIFVISDSARTNATGGLASLSGTSPTLPGTHDTFRRVGWVLTDGSSNIIKFIQRERWIYYDALNTTLEVINDGSATVHTAISCSSYVPTTSQKAFMRIRFKTGSAGAAADRLRIRPGDITTTSFGIQIRPGVVSGTTMSVVTEVPLDSSQEIDYRVEQAANATTIAVLGYEDAA